MITPAQPAQQEVLLPLSTDVLNLIESFRQKNKYDDIMLNVKINGLYLAWPVRPQQAAPFDVKSFSHGISFSLGIAEWKKALGLIEHRITLLDTETIDKLDGLRRKWGLWRVEDVIQKFVEAYEGIGIKMTHQFLATMIDSKTIRDKIAELASSPRWREVSAISPYIDNTGAEYLLKIARNGAKVKIITRKPDNKAQSDALEALKQNGIEIKIHKMAHARMIVFDDLVAIVSSADLDSQGLNNQRQAGIFTTDKTVVRDAMVFFEKLWNEAIFG